MIPKFYQDELYHHGIIGMKWGVRRYQNKDGTLTKAGKKRYSDSEKDARKKNQKAIIDKAFEKTVKTGKDKPNISPAEAMARNASNAISNTKTVANAFRSMSNKSSKPDLSHMSDAELKDRVNRMQLERSYLSLTSDEVSRGRKYFDSTLDAVSGIAGIAGSVAATIALMKSLRKGG